MRALVLLASLTALCAQDFEQELQGKWLTMRFRAGEVANLAWQVDTLAGRTNTRPADYENLWKKELQWTATDHEKIKPQAQLTLEPYERDHALVVGVYRAPPKKA